MRRGQMEIIGLVLIVAVLLIGIVVYLQLSADNPGLEGVQAAKDVQGTTSFVVALSETSVEACGGVPFWRVARACAERERFCASQDPCGALQETVDAVAAATLAAQGLKYNLSVEHTPVQSAQECDLTMDRSAATPVPILLSNGESVSLVLVLCR